MSLLADSEAYYSKVELYEEFAEAEDRPNYVAKFLQKRLKGKTVLDLGCGTGKYLQLLAPTCKAMIGIDQSPAVLQVAKEKLSVVENVQLILTQAQELPVPAHSIDTVIACWVLGTMSDTERRYAFDECQRVLKAGGEVLLVENDLGGEFEEIRGKTVPNSPSYIYHQELSNLYKFVPLVRFDTYFEFKDQLSAQRVFAKIWNGGVADKIYGSRIKHKIVVYGWWKTKVYI